MSELKNQRPSQCEGCPLHEKSRGFVLGQGDPTKAKYAMILEAPGSQEINLILKPNPNRAFLTTQEECNKEIVTRRRDYPQLEERFIKQGLPISGPTGAALQFWIFPKLNLRREEFYIDNTIRCLAPATKTGERYPTGEERKAAELHCRQYDRLAHFKPNTAVISLHPAGILREITPLPLAVKDMEKVRDFAAQGRRVVTLLGGKAANAFLRYGSNVTRWRGHYQELASDWSETYKKRFEFTKKKKKEKKNDKAGKGNCDQGVVAGELHGGV